MWRYHLDSSAFVSSAVLVWRELQSRIYTNTYRLLQLKLVHPFLLYYTWDSQRLKPEGHSWKLTEGQRLVNKSILAVNLSAFNCNRCSQNGRACQLWVQCWQRSFTHIILPAELVYLISITSCKRKWHALMASRPWIRGGRKDLISGSWL